MKTMESLIVKVDMHQEDGMVLASSKDVPGLHICGVSMQAACESAMNAIQLLFKHNKHVDVLVTQAGIEDGSHESKYASFLVQYSRA